MPARAPPSSSSSSSSSTSHGQTRMPRNQRVSRAPENPYDVARRRAFTRTVKSKLCDLAFVMRSTEDVTDEIADEGQRIVEFIIGKCVDIVDGSYRKMITANDFDRVVRQYAGIELYG